MKLTKNYSRVAIQRTVYQQALEKFTAGLPFDNLFKPGMTRVIIPLVSPKKYELSQILGEYGYDYIDWVAGDAIKVIPPHEKAPPGTLAKVQRTKLGKAISRLPEGEDWLDWWSDNKESLKEDEYSIIISRHPVDVVRMSDHRNWNSCHSPGDQEWESCLSEMTHGGLVAYLVKSEDLKDLSPEAVSGDNEIFEDRDRGVDGIEPLSRLRLRRFTHEDGDLDLALPENKIYGMRNTAFQEQVLDWARKVQEPVVGDERFRMSDFVRRGGEYADSQDSKLFNEFFGDNLDRGNTSFGMPGEEEEDTAQRLRNEIEEIHTRWQNDLNHCSTYYEEYDEQHGAEIQFYWNGSMGVEIPKNMLLPERIDEIDNSNILNRGTGSLKDYLSDESFYVGDGDINVNNYGDSVSFGIDINDPDRMSGSPDEYNAYCRSISDDWDDKYDEVRGIILKWLLDNEFATPTPVREFSTSEFQFQNFEVKFDGGDMTAAAEGFIGQYYPELDTASESTIEPAIRNMVSMELARIINELKHPQGYLPGFEPPEVPTNIKEHYLYNLSNFTLRLKRRWDSSIPKIALIITFEANDLTSEEDMAEVIELMRVVDRLFPRILDEATRLLEIHHEQKRNKLRAEEMRRSPENPALV